MVNSAGSIKPTAEELWRVLSGDYKRKKGDPHGDSDALRVLQAFLDTGFDPKRIRAAYNFFIEDITEGSQHGYKMSRFASSSTKYFERVRQGDGSRPTQRERSLNRGSAYYRCDVCHREVTGLLKASDGDAEFPPVWGDCDPHHSPNNYRPIETGCRGVLRQVIPGELQTRSDAG